MLYEYCVSFALQSEYIDHSYLSFLIFLGRTGGIHKEGTETDSRHENKRSGLQQREFMPAVWQVLVSSLHYFNTFY